MDNSRFDVDRLVSLGRVGNVAVSPDGTWLCAAVERLHSEGGKFVSDLWKVPLDDPGAPPVRLTWTDAGDRAPCFRADGALGYLSNRNPRAGKAEEGDEDRFQVWIFPPGGGEPRPLTDEPLGVLEYKFAADAHRLVALASVHPGVPHDEQRKHAADRKKNGPSLVFSRETPVRYWDHWIGPEATHVIAYAGDGTGRKDLTPEATREHSVDPSWDFSRDGTRVAITTQSLGADRIIEKGLLVIDVDTGKSRVIGLEPASELTLPRFSHDGRRVACSRERRSPETLSVGLWVAEVETGKGWDLELDFWPMPQTWTADGESVVCTGDYRGEVPVFQVSAQDGKATRVTDPAAGGSHEGISLHPAGKELLGVRHRIIHPPEPFRVALAPAAQPELVARLSGFAEGEAAFARVEKLAIEGDGGTPIDTYLVSPAGGGEASPLLFWIHGGPISAYSDGWHWRWNPLVGVDAGYAVALPNPRGSTGYGPAFIEGIWKNRWGAACYRDLMAVCDRLAAREEIDSERMVAMGGSFGGYMANWIGTQTDRFKALVTHASLYALSSFYGSTDLPAWMALEWGGVSPYTDLEAFDRYSPHRHLENWKTPTLILHGERDYRVPIGEGLALFDALQMQGVPSELAVFPDENHWILKPSNIKTWYRTWIDFVDRHLAPEREPQPSST